MEQFWTIGRNKRTAVCLSKEISKSLESIFFWDILFCLYFLYLNNFIHAEYIHPKLNTNQDATPLTDSDQHLTAPLLTQ